MISAAGSGASMTNRRVASPHGAVARRTEPSGPRRRPGTTLTVFNPHGHAGLGRASVLGAGMTSLLFLLLVLLTRSGTMALQLVEKRTGQLRHQAIMTRSPIYPTERSFSTALNR